MTAVDCNSQSRSRSPPRLSGWRVGGGGLGFGAPKKVRIPAREIDQFGRCRFKKMNSICCSSRRQFSVPLWLFRQHLLEAQRDQFLEWLERRVLDHRHLQDLLRRRADGLSAQTGADDLLELLRELYFAFALDERQLRRRKRFGKHLVQLAKILKGTGL